MAVVIEEFDIGDMSWSTLGRIEDGEIVTDGDSFLSELLSDDELEDEEELLNRFNGPRLVAYKVNNTFGKNWIPYEGPMGGEGWQNANDPDDVRYQDDAPGEIEPGYEEMAEGWGQNDQERFISDVRDEYGLSEGSVARVATSKSPLYTDWDVGAFKIALKSSVYEVTDNKEGHVTDNSKADEIYEEIADQFYDELQTNTDPRYASALLFEAVENTEDAPMFLMNDFSDRLEMFRWDDDNVPEPPLEGRDNRDWYEDIPEANEDFTQDSLNEQDAVLYEDEDIGFVPGRIFRHEGYDDELGDYLYTLEDGSTIYRDDMVAFSPNENQAIRFNGYQRAKEGHYLVFKHPSTGEPVGGEVSNIHVEEGNEITAKLITQGGSHTVHSTDEGGLRFNENDTKVSVLERHQETPEDFDGVLTGMEEDARTLASEINDNIESEFGVEDEVEAELRKKFSKTAVDKFYQAVKDWKQDSSGGMSGQHAQAFKQALDIKSKTRGWDKASREHEKIAEVMYELTQQRFATNMTAYRGMSHTGFGRLIDTWMDNPDAEELELSQLAINNYSKNRDVARRFSEGTALIETRLKPEQIAFAMDYLAARELDNESEMHVIGDNVTAQTSDIRVEGVPLGDFPEDLHTTEHADIANVIEDLYARRMPVDKETHEQLFERWADIVRNEHPSLLQGENENERVRQLIQEIEKNQKLVYDIERGPQTQLDEFGDDKEIPTVDLTDPGSLHWNQETEGQPEGLTEARMEALRNWRNAVAKNASSPIGKAWIPYEGPRGGEGWQSANDPNRVVYQQDPPGEVEEGYEADHWEKYPSDGNWPESPHGTRWEQPEGFGRDAGMQLTDAVAFINYDDEVVAGQIAEFRPEDKTYKLENGYVISHSQVVGWSEPEEGERVETSVGMVTEGDWITYDTAYSEDNVAQVSDIEINDDMDVISVVGDYGYEEIEVTGRKHNRNEQNAKIQRIHTDEPDMFANVKQNGMAMDTKDIVAEIDERIDLTDTQTFNDQLKQETRENIRSALNTYFPEAYVQAYYDSVSMWKINNRQGSSEQHEMAFKEALGIESPTHTRAINEKEPSSAAKAHQKIAKVMAGLSNKYWEENFGGRAEVHRGISNTAFQDLFPKWLESPNAPKYDVEQLALNNFSRSRHVANGFGEETAVVSLEANKDDVVLCTDAISNIGTVEDESEIQIHGDDQTVDSRQIHLFGKDGPTLGEHPSDWDKREHTEFGQFMKTYYMNKTDEAGEDEPPLPEKHYKTLLEWSRAVSDAYPDLARRQPSIQTLSREIEHDSEAYYGLGPLGKQYTETFTEQTREATNNPTIDLTDKDSATWLSDASKKPHREDISDHLFEELVEANRRKRESFNESAEDTHNGPMRLKGRVEVDSLNKPDWNPVNDSTLKKVGDNFEKVDDLLLDAWEKQVCADSLEKAPNMWRRGDNVPQFVRTFVKQAATKRDALWDEYNDVPHMAALKVHEIIKDNVTNDGWSIETISNDLTDEFEGITKKQAETIARTEVAAVLNDARAMSYKASGEDLQFRWTGPNDEHTTDLCIEVKQEIENRGGSVDMPTLKNILLEKARKYKHDGGTPERVDSWIAHYNERQTVTRASFRWL